MDFGIDYDTRKNVLRVGTVAAGLYALWPDTFGMVANYPIFGVVSPRMIVGAVAILFAIGSWKKWW